MHGTLHVEQQLAVPDLANLTGRSDLARAPYWLLIVQHNEVSSGRFLRTTVGPMLPT